MIENGFYYDFFRNEAFTPEDFAAIEKRMREIIARDKPFSKRAVSREEAKSLFEKKGEAFKVELVDAIPPDQEVKLYSQGEWDSPLPWASYDVNGQGRRRVQADESRRRLLAW